MIKERGFLERGHFGGGVRINVKRKKEENPFGKIKEKNQLKYEKKVQEYVLTYYGQMYSLYQMLYAVK